MKVLVVIITLLLYSASAKLLRIRRHMTPPTMNRIKSKTLKNDVFPATWYLSPMELAQTQQTDPFLGDLRYSWDHPVHAHEKSPCVSQFAPQQWCGANHHHHAGHHQSYKHHAGQTVTESTEYDHKPRYVFDEEPKDNLPLLGSSPNSHPPQPASISYDSNIEPERPSGHQKHRLSQISSDGRPEKRPKYSKSKKSKRPSKYISIHPGEYPPSKKRPKRPHTHAKRPVFSPKIEDYNSESVSEFIPESWDYPTGITVKPQKRPKQQKNTGYQDFNSPLEPESWDLPPDKVGQPEKSPKKPLNTGYQHYNSPLESESWDLPPDKVEQTGKSPKKPLNSEIIYYDSLSAPKSWDKSPKPSKRPRPTPVPDSKSSYYDSPSVPQSWDEPPKPSKRPAKRPTSIKDTEILYYDSPAPQSWDEPPKRKPSKRPAKHLTPVTVKAIADYDSGLIPESRDYYQESGKQPGKRPKQRPSNGISFYDSVSVPHSWDEPPRPSKRPVKRPLLENIYPDYNSATVPGGWDYSQEPGGQFVKRPQQQTTSMPKRLHYHVSGGSSGKSPPQSSDNVIPEQDQATDNWDEAPNESDEYEGYSSNVPEALDEYYEPDVQTEQLPNSYDYEAPKSWDYAQEISGRPPKNVWPKYQEPQKHWHDFLKPKGPPKKRPQQSADTLSKYDSNSLAPGPATPADSLDYLPVGNSPQLSEDDTVYTRSFR